MSRGVPDELQREADLASIAEGLDAIELAAAVADGGIDPSELTDDQLRILLSAESADVVAALLTEQTGKQGQTEQSGSFVFMEYVRRWSPAIGSLAVAAALVVVGLVGFRPSAGLSWNAPANIASLPGIKSPLPLSDRPLIAFLNQGERPLVLLDAHAHDSGRALSFSLARLDAQSVLKPHAIVTFRSPVAVRPQAPELTASGAVADASWLDRVCAGGYTVFIASTASGDACWGTIGEGCRDEVVGIWSDPPAAWAPEGAPERALMEVHQSMFRGAPFAAPAVWRKD